MRRSILRDRLDQSRPIHCFSCALDSLMVPHLLGSAGVDCLWLDSEHWPMDMPTLFGHIQMAHRTDTDALVRVPHGRLDAASLILDAGADAIMYPRVRSIEDVRLLVDWVRFPPLGRRGLATMTPASGYGMRPPMQFVRDSEATVVVLQIETREALEHVDAIAAIRGIDLLFIGTADLGLELGVDLAWGSQGLNDVIARVAAASAKHGLAWGMIVENPDHAKYVLNAGGTLLVYGGDVGALRKAAISLTSEYSAMGIAFGRAAAGGDQQHITA